MLLEQVKKIYGDDFLVFFNSSREEEANEVYMIDDSSSVESLKESFNIISWLLKNKSYIKNIEIVSVKNGLKKIFSLSRLNGKVNTKWFI